MKRNDLTGKKFGTVNVIGFSHKQGSQCYWLCKCECGKEYTSGSATLPNAKSCGDAIHSHRFIDIVGNRYGRLTVVFTDELKNNKDGRRLRKCECDCGIIVWKSKNWLDKNIYPFCGKDCKLKKCPTCKQDKPKTEYHKNGNSLQTICKKCKAEFYLENRSEIMDKYNSEAKTPIVKERRRLISKKSRQKHTDREKAYKHEYERRPEVMARRRERHHERKATDLQYNIKKRLRGRVRDIIKQLLKNKKYKFASAMELVGCDIHFLKSHLESTFTNGMSWDRISEIHIDHIKPCNMFKLTELSEQKLCFHWTNLQMLWWQDNLRKGKSEIG